MKVMDESTLARFMAKVNKTETCWLWTASRNRNGYGQFGIKKTDGTNTMVEPHRLLYKHHHGEIPEGLVVRHKCLNKHCVNPDHLEVGTEKENQADRVRDGTALYGEKHQSSKLTEAQVRDIRNRVGQLQKEIAEEFGVAFQTISKIRRGERWTHI